MPKLYYAERSGHVEAWVVDDSFRRYKFTGTMTDLQRYASGKFELIPA